MQRKTELLCSEYLSIACVFKVAHPATCNIGPCGQNISSLAHHINSQIIIHCDTILTSSDNDSELLKASASNFTTPFSIAASTAVSDIEETLD